MGSTESNARDMTSLPGNAGAPAREVTAFDPVDAMSRVGDDRELLAQMVMIFRAESLKMLVSIRKAAASGDGNALSRAAHSLKGSAGNFGPGPTYDLARELERMGHDGQLAGAEAKVAELEARLAELELALLEFVETSVVDG
jgi:two-component system, sensor histidine kinase and response regulator